MSRIPPVDRNDAADESVRRNFDGIEKKLGMVPTMMRTMAQSPRVLEGYLALSGALSRGFLPAALQAQIALAVAEANGCDYCLSAHTVLGRLAGLSEDQLTASREGRDAEKKTTAALQFALTVVRTRGGIANDDCARMRAVGYTEGEVAEILAHVALNVFTNYFNRAAGTEIDFPKVTAGQLA